MSRPLAEHEVARILALVPWIVAHPGRPKAEVAARFGISRARLEADLRLVLLVGVPPYTPDEYIEVDAEGETVTIRLADWFHRPLRLSPAEGLALLAAGRALLAVPGSDADGPLGRAVAKLARALGDPEVTVALDAPAFLEPLRAAAADAARVEIAYWSAGRDALTERRIDPHVVFWALGRWYAAGWCHAAGADRTFRVDRIRALRPTGEHFETPGERPLPDPVYRPRPEDPRITLAVSGDVTWLVEQHPVERVTRRGDGRTEVVLAVAERAFLERLVLRLGPGAEVLDPPEWRAAGEQAARRVLARYEAPAST